MHSLGRTLLFAAAATGAALGFSGSAQAATPCAGGISFGGDFAGHYSCSTLGTPTGVTGLLGGLTFLDRDTLLIGGNANGSSGYIAQIGVTRDDDGHIVDFSGPSSFYASAPYIDGGLAFGPDGVLFATGYPNNTLVQIKPGSTEPDKILTLPGTLSSVGSLAFVPDGFAGAGALKLLSYSTGRFAEATLTPDGSGTFDVTLGDVVTLGGGPEGMVYIKGSNEGFGGTDSLLVSEYGWGSIGAYELDAQGNPIVDSRRTFLSGLSGAEGALIDPFTGDFLFSTFGGGNQVVVISGFKAPTPPSPAVPEPASWAMMLLGFGLAGAGMRHSRRSLRVRFA